MTTKDAHTYWTTVAHEVSLVSTQQDNDEDEHYKHQFGLCNKCSCGLDDKSDFVLLYTMMNRNDAIVVCNECYQKSTTPLPCGMRASTPTPI